MKSYEILLERRAIKQLEKINENIKRRILNVLRGLRDRGFSQTLDIKKLKGYKAHYRLRVDEYRILFEFRRPRTIIV